MFIPSIPAVCGVSGAVLPLADDHSHWQLSMEDSQPFPAGIRISSCLPSLSFQTKTLPNLLPCWSCSCLPGSPLPGGFGCFSGMWSPGAAQRPGCCSHPAPLSIQPSLELPVNYMVLIMELLGSASLLFLMSSAVFCPASAGKIPSFKREALQGNCGNCRGLLGWLMCLSIHGAHLCPSPLSSLMDFINCMKDPKLLTWL